MWVIYPDPSSPTLDEALERWNGSDDDLVTVVFLDATWQFAKEMDNANMASGAYPPQTVHVRLGDEDFARLPQEKRFHIRKPPTEQHLSTAECLAYVTSRVEGKPEIYDTIMRPLDLMVQKWESFINAGKSNRKDEE